MVAGKLTQLGPDLRRLFCYAVTFLENHGFYRSFVCFRQRTAVIFYKLNSNSEQNKLHGIGQLCYNEFIEVRFFC